MSLLLKSILSFIRHPIVLKGFQILFALILICYAVVLIHYHYYLATFPYPIIYPEGAMMSTTVNLLHGVNPYNFVTEPAYTNNYGIVYPLIVLPIASIFGVDLVVHRAVTAFFIFASCFVIFLVIKKNKTPLLLNCWAVLTLYASFLYPLTSTPCVDPASTGLFFMLLSIFIPFFLEYSYGSLILSIIFGLLAFYTKAYFFLGLPVMVSYLFFFVSKKRSLFLGISCLISLIGSIFVMNLFFPSYFNDCFFISYNVSASTSMIIVLFRQLHNYSELYKSIFLLIAALGVYGISLWLRAVRAKGTIKIFKDCLSTIRFMNWNEGLIIKRLPLEDYVGLCTATVLILFMGRHLGSNLWYFFQLFSPFLVIFVARITGRFPLWPILFSFLLVYNLYSLSSKDDYKFFDKKNIKGWDIIEMLVKSKKNIYNSPLLAPIMIKNNREIFDNGTQYYPLGGKRLGIPGRFFKDDIRVDTAKTAYVNKIRDMVRNKEFNLIIIEMAYSSYALPDDLTKSYKFVGPIPVLLPQDRKFFMMTVWRPI